MSRENQRDAFHENKSISLSHKLGNDNQKVVLIDAALYLPVFN